MDADIGLFVLRAIVGAIVMAHGLMKLGWFGKGGTVTGTGKWFDSVGLRPGMFWAIVATLAETAGGLLMVAGLGGPLGAGIVAGDLLVVTIVAHWQQGFWVGGGKVGIEFPTSLFAGALAVALVGNGRWSLDTALTLTYPEWLLPAWLAVTALGAGLALAARTLFAPKKAA